MEKDQVPQDDENMLDGKLRVLKYAVDKDGNYTKVPSLGWEPENVVLKQAWEDINSKIDGVKNRVLSGELSPIAYYMEKNMMDLSMLKQYTGYWGFQVKNHLKAKGFSKLSPTQLAKYASIFQISVDELINFTRS